MDFSENKMNISIQQMYKKYESNIYQWRSQDFIWGPADLYMPHSKMTWGPGAVWGPGPRRAKFLKTAPWK